MTISAARSAQSNSVSIDPMGGIIGSGYWPDSR